MKYLFLLVIFLNCSDFFNKSKKTDEITKIEIKYEGEIDKPLPKIIFCKDGKEYSNFETYSFNLNNIFFEKMKNCFLSLIGKSNKKKDNTALSVNINSQKSSFFLTKKEAKKFIQEIIIQSSYKKNSLLQDQLKRYYRILE